jgi:hypothetical protein
MTMMAMMTMAAAVTALVGLVMDTMALPVVAIR